MNDVTQRVHSLVWHKAWSNTLQQVGTQLYIRSRTRRFSEWQRQLISEMRRQV